MKKLEKQPYKIVQYVDGFCGDWGLGFSMVDQDGYGWEFNPVDKRKYSRHPRYRLTDNIERGETTFSYGFKND